MADYFLLFDNFHRVSFLERQVLCLNLSRVHIIRCRSILSAVESRSNDFHTWNNICKCCSLCWISIMLSIFLCCSSYVGFQHCLRYLCVVAHVGLRLSILFHWDKQAQHKFRLISIIFAVPKFVMGLESENNSCVRILCRTLGEKYGWNGVVQEMIKWLIFSKRHLILTYLFRRGFECRVQWLHSMYCRDFHPVIRIPG